MAVLDPQRISGMMESNLSRGFGYIPCPGEVAYVKFPEVDVAAATHEPLVRIQSIYRGNDHITVLVQWTSFQVEFVFSLDLRPLSARPLQGFAELHSRLQKEGKIQSAYGTDYTEDLRQGVRFWDGKEWRKEVVTILR
jgi:hypothetical protein